MQGYADKPDSVACFGDAVANAGDKVRDLFGSGRVGCVLVILLGIVERLDVLSRLVAEQTAITSIIERPG